MSRYLPVDEFNTGAIGAGATEDFHRSFGYSNLNIVKIRVTPSGASVGYNLSIYKDEDLTEKLYSTIPTLTNIFYHPQTKLGGGALEGFVVPYVDLDDEGKVHLTITNNDAVSRSYQVEITCEAPALVTAANTWSELQTFDAGINLGTSQSIDGATSVIQKVDGTTLATWTIPDGSTKFKALNIEALLAAVSSQAQTGVDMTIYSAGTSARPQTGMSLFLGGVPDVGGYHGSQSTRGLHVSNWSNGTVNYGIDADTPGGVGGAGGDPYANTGLTNIGVHGRGKDATQVSVGGWFTNQSSNSPLHVGVAGFSINGTINIPGYFAILDDMSKLVANFAASGTQSVIVASNGASGSPLFIGYNNISEVFRVSETGGVSATSITNSGLTEGRIPIVGIGGLIGDDANLTFSTDTLSTTKLLSSTSVSTPSLISTAAITAVPAAGSSFNVNLSTTGDFIVNTDQFAVDTSTARIGIGTASPSVRLHLSGTTANTTTLYMERDSAGVASAIQTFLKKRGGAIVQSGDLTGLISFQGWDGAAYQTTAQIYSSVGGTPGLNDMPGSFGISTTPDGSVTPVERFAIDQAGNVTITASLLGATISGASNTLSNIANASLTNSSITIQGSAVSLGDTTLATNSTPTFAGIASLAALALTPASGSNLNITLVGTGDLAVNTNQFYVDTSTGFVGLGTPTPLDSLHIVKESRGFDATFFAGPFGIRYPIVVEAQDAVVALLSEDEGGHGSGINFMEAEAGNLSWSWLLFAGTTSGVYGGDFILKSGSDKDYTANSVVMRIHRNGYINQDVRINGNVDIGVQEALKAWDADVHVIQLGGNLALMSQRAAADGNDSHIIHNAYWSSAAGWKRISADEAASYRIGEHGTHLFRVAGSDTADSAITWTDALTIANNAAITASSTFTATSTIRSNSGFNVNGTAGFTGTGAYTNFTIVGGIITAAS